MKTLSHLVLALLCTITFLACGEEDPIIINPRQINFQAPAVGQENYYLRYSGECGELLPTSDTLILRIKSFNGTDLEFEEIYTNGSPSFNPYGFVYPATWNTDMVEIKSEFRQSSSLFFFYGSDFLKLKQPASRAMYQNACLVWNDQAIFTGDDIGILPAFNVGEQTYSSKKVVSCVPTIFDLDAYLIYDENNLYSSFTGSIWEFGGTEHLSIDAFALISIDN